MLAPFGALESGHWHWKAKWYPLFQNKLLDKEKMKSTKQGHIATLNKDDDEAIKQVEAVLDVAEEAVDDHLEQHLDGEQRTEEQVAVLEHHRQEVNGYLPQSLISGHWICYQCAYVLGGRNGIRHGKTALQESRLNTPGTTGLP